MFWGGLQIIRRHQGSLEVKNGPQNKNCTIKIHFIRTNRIQDDDVNHKGKICKNRWREEEKPTFSYRIFGISTYGFTQISSLGTHWMHNLILHTTHTQLRTSKVPTTPKNENLNNKAYIKIHFFIEIFICGCHGYLRSMQFGMGWMWN